jgi:hypothetical protein
MVGRLPHVLSLAGILVGFILLEPGCGGDDSSGAAAPDATATNDSAAGGPDTASSDGSVATADVPSSDTLVVNTNDSSPPDVAGTFCQAVQQFHQRCNLTSQCQQQNLAACGAQESSFSAAAVQAGIACLATDSCDLDGGRAMNTACFEQHLSGATPTAAQRAVAMSFCAQCRPDVGAASCESAFFNIAGEASINIIGFLLLEVSDVTATNIETSCTGAFLDDAGNPQSCIAKFFVCADKLALQASPGDACKANDAGAGG